MNGIMLMLWDSVPSWRGSIAHFVSTHRPTWCASRQRSPYNQPHEDNHTAAFNTTVAYVANHNYYVQYRGVLGQPFLLRSIQYRRTRPTIT